MALTFNYSKVKDWQTVCHDKDGNITPVTETIIMLTMFAGIPEIRESNWIKFYTRVHLLEKVGGAFMRQIIDGKPVDRLVTYEDVKSHIGLYTNASSKTDTQFYKYLKNETEREAKKHE